MSMTKERRTELDTSALEAAVRISPEGFLRQLYGKAVTVTGGGRSIRVRDVLRGDRRGDGHWVHCDWHGGGIGNNINMVRQLTGRGFIQAIETLVGTATMPVAPIVIPQAPPALTRPRVPSLNGVAEGRAYLEGRGISPQSIVAAEQAGALRYCRGAVLFIGRDHEHPRQEIRLATLRHLEPQPGPDGELMTKRDLAGSNKNFPVLLPGDPSVVAIVEGGVNALGVRDIGLRRGVCPTVIATGGVGVRHWATENPVLRELLAKAERVLIFGENEVGQDGALDPVKQERTDLLRMRLAETVAEVRDGQLPSMVYPPPTIKDAADWAQSMLYQRGPVMQVEPPEAEVEHSADLAPAY